MSRNNERRPKLTDAEIAHMALEKRHGKKQRLSKEWTIKPEDLEGMSDDEIAEWIALAGTARLDVNRGMTKRTSGTLEDAAEGRRRPDSPIPSMRLPNGVGKLRRI
jgi:hypothetical protein